MVLLRKKKAGLAKTTGVAAAPGALALAVFLAAPAIAQENSGLRGTIGGQDIAAPSPARMPTVRRAAARGTVEDTATTSTQTREPRAPDEDASARQMPDNERVGAVESRSPQPQEDAFAPPGVNAGSFVLRPQLEQGIGWTSNAAGVPDGRESVYSETRLLLDARSDWSRHAAALAGDLRWRKSLSGDRIDEVEGGVNGRLDLDLANELSAFAAAGYRVVPESASTPGTVVASVSRPLRHTIDASAGLSRDAGLLRLGLTGSMTREMFGDAELADGAMASQHERDSTLATAALRIGYAASPALMPFIEMEAGRRFHDLKHDSAGYARSAGHYALRGGVAVDLGEKLAGEFSAGWLTERPDDHRLDPISGLSVAGDLSWSPVRGTAIGLAAATSVESATAPGVTGSLLYSGALSLRRELRANLTGELAAGIDWRDYSSGGHDLILHGEASLTWWMNRYAGVTARARHEKQESSLAGRNYHATSMWLGMTFRR